MLSTLESPLDALPPPDWFQPWPRDALFSVGRKFLSEMDLGSDGIRGAIERFLPLSFKVVNTAAEAFKSAERRWVAARSRLVDDNFGGFRDDQRL